MQKKIYFLSTCSTCKRIMTELKIDDSFEQQDIKTNKITAIQLDEMAKRSGDFESLFSRKAMKFRAQGLHEKDLSEKDYRNLILEEYTFLKRPVFLIGDEIFIGNSKKNVAAVAEVLQN